MLILFTCINSPATCTLLTPRHWNGAHNLNYVFGQFEDMIFRYVFWIKLSDLYGAVRVGILSRQQHLQQGWPFFLFFSFFSTKEDLTTSERIMLRPVDMGITYCWSNSFPKFHYNAPYFSIMFHFTPFVRFSFLSSLQLK